MERRRRKLSDSNRLESTEPVILVFPEGSWEEIFPQGALSCTDPFARSLELDLRQRLFTEEEIKDDSVVIPCVFVERAVEIGDYGVDVPRRQGDHRGSYVWDAPVGDIARFCDLVSHRSLFHNSEETRRRREAAQELVGDTLEVQEVCHPWWTLGMTWKIIDLVGMENLMVSMLDEPEAVHSMMAWMRDEHLAFLAWMEAEGVLTSAHEGAYCGSGGFGFTDELEAPSEGPAPLNQRWGFAESQETVGISPGMFEEFVLEYQIPLLEKFGLNYYGCCEPLELRWESVKRIPRLRRVSISPWCNEEKMSQELGRDYVYCRKPNPAPFSVGFSEEVMRESLVRTFEVARGCVVEVILKDTHTCEHDSGRFGKWVELARQTLDRVWRP